MQNFLRRILSSFKEYILVVCLLIISLSVLSLNNSPDAKNIRRISLATFAVFNSFVDDISDLFVNEDALLEQKKINSQLMLQVNKLREYGLENIYLKKMLGYKQSVDENLKPARIISKFVSNIQGVYVINLGASDSIAVGMPVINEKGLAGIVVEVTNNFSLVRNLYNSNLKIAVSVQRSNIDGILKYNGSDLMIENIPTTYDVKVGDRLVVSEFSTIFPPSIPVGIITKSTTDISGVLNTLTVEPYVDLESLKNVFVLQVVRSREVDSLQLNLLGK
jgi:rod shape-determining protein MreC